MKPGQYHRIDQQDTGNDDLKAIALNTHLYNKIGIPTTLVWNGFDRFTICVSFLHLNISKKLVNLRHQVIFTVNHRGYTACGVFQSGFEARKICPRFSKK